MSYADGFLLRREVPEAELLGALAQVVGVARERLVALMAEAPEGVVRYEVVYRAEGLRTQLDLYGLDAPLDPVRSSVALASLLATDVARSPPRDSRWSENPSAWICARPSGEVGIQLQPDPEVLDLPVDGPLRPLE